MKDKLKIYLKKGGKRIHVYQIEYLLLFISSKKSLMD